MRPNSVSGYAKQSGHFCWLLIADRWYLGGVDLMLSLTWQPHRTEWPRRGHTPPGYGLPKLKCRSFDEIFALEIPLWQTSDATNDENFDKIHASDKNLVKMWTFRFPVMCVYVCDMRENCILPFAFPEVIPLMRWCCLCDHSGSRLGIEISSYQYRDSRYKDKTVSRPYRLYIEMGPWCLNTVGSRYNRIQHNKIWCGCLSYFRENGGVITGSKYSYIHIQQARLIVKTPLIKQNSRFTPTCTHARSHIG